MPPSLLREVLHVPRDWLRKVRRARRRLLFHPSVSRDILKLRLAILFETIVKAAPGSRVKAFQLLYPSRSAPCSVSSAVTCEINSLADFQSSYSHLAAMLGHAGKTPPPSEMEFLRRIDNRRIEYQGRIGMNDC